MTVYIQAGSEVQLNFHAADREAIGKALAAPGVAKLDAKALRAIFASAGDTAVRMIRQDDWPGFVKTLE